MTSEPSKQPDLRASDADRERVVEILRDALAEGRLDMGEFEQRLDTAYKSRTYGELEPLTRDLPEAARAFAPVPVAEGRTAWAERIGGTRTSSWGVGILGGFQRKGAWVAPREFTAVAVCGGGEIDLREARFEDREIVIRCFAVMGGVNVVVPPGVQVDVRGIGIMGGFDDDASGPGDPGGPRVVVTGLAIWGGVAVERKLRKEERRRLKEERRLEREERRERKSLE